MLLLPFLAGALTQGDWDRTVAVRLLAVLLAFVLREPLTVLARQRWVWRVRRAETKVAVRAISWQTPALVLCGAYLWMRLPHWPLAILGAGGALWTSIAIRMTILNRIRSLALQLVSTFVLASTGLLAALSESASLPSWSWPLWALMGVHGSIGVITVHARLERRLRSARGTGGISAAARIGAALLLLTALIAWQFDFGAYAPPLAFSAFVAVIELVRLKRVPDEAFTRVGIRMMLLSLVHMALVVNALRP